MSNRLIGALPKVGIRPVIDGHERGVRESLEQQVLELASAVAVFIEERIQFPSGEKVKCIIADTCIGGVAEAAMCAEKFHKEGVGVSLTVTSCWCYGTEVMANWGASHGAISYGHIGANLITLASMLRIPVNMHNLEDKMIFRLAA